MSKQAYVISIVSVFLYFVLGKYMLNDLIGIPYYHEGGSPIFKIHLATYILILSTCYFLLVAGVSSFYKKIGSAATIYFLVVLAVIVFSLYTRGMSGIAFVLDTLLAPVFILYISTFMSLKQKESTIKFILILLVANSLMAIAEFIIGKNFIPREAPVFEFRSWALLSHPLNNTLITVSIFFLLIRYSTFTYRLSLFLIMIIAMLAFGGRAGFALFIVISICLIFPFVKNFIRGQLYTNHWVIVVSIGFMFLMAIFILVAYDLGIGRRIFEGFYADDSAMTRIDVFDLFYMVSFSELLWGVEETFYLIVAEVAAVETIENVWFAWIFQFGLVLTLPLIFSLVRLLYSLSKGDYYRSVIFFFFLILCSANNSLATKTPALIFFILVLYLDHSRDRSFILRSNKEV